ncbi:MAG: hypothetical protein ACYTEQ_20800 [Planctomycetota bacterium]|jgi:hypothetical protein
MTDDEKEFGNFVRQIEFDDSPDPNHRDRLEETLLRALTEQKSRRENVWRAIMKTRMTRFAAAAAIVASALGVILWERSATPAYAITQTIEVMKNVRTVHIIGRDWQEGRIEMWAEVYPDTGLMKYCRLEEIDAGRLTVSRPTCTHYYDRKSKTVRIKDGPGVSSIFRLGRFIEDMSELTKKLNGTITHYETFDTNLNRDVIVVQMISSLLELRAIIDPETKLPMNVNVVRGQQPGSCEIFKHADEIYYGKSLPDGLFDFKIPDGATIVEETVQDASNELPGSVVRFVFRFHLEAVEKATKAQGIWVNTQLYLVDSGFNLTHGGFLSVYNGSNDIWTGQVSVCNTDAPNMSVYDRAGEKQKIRMVQHRAFSPGKFRVYWELDEPLHPGQSKVGLYWAENPEQLTSATADASYHLRMMNSPACEVVESFILIVPSDIKIENESEDHISHETMDGYDIYIWQKRLPARRLNHIVDVLLKHGGQQP